MAEAFAFTQADHDALLNHVFPERLSTLKGSLSISDISNHLQQTVASVVNEEEILDNERQYYNGRLGPAKVQLDSKNSSGGQMLFDLSRLLVVSQSEFCTARASCCVFAGKWCFEVLLCSSGLLQIGWCTARCSFTQEYGVGDTANSFSYDGSRVRKWNASFASYGEAWSAHDVITCCIDCDNGTITYYRNSRSLGEAFSNVPVGRGIAYFPALSLSNGEAAIVNFGATPFVYPVPGYKPLQLAPIKLETSTTPLITYLERLIPIAVETQKDSGQQLPLSRYSTCWLIASHIIPSLEPALTNEYIVAKLLLPLLNKFCDITCPATDKQSHLDLIVNFLCSFLNANSCKKVLTSIVSVVFVSYHCHRTPGYKHQRTCLTILLSLLKHQNARKFLISKVLFDCIELPVLLHLEPLYDNDVFARQPLFENASIVKNHPKSPSITWQLNSLAKERLAQHHSAVASVTELHQQIMQALLIHTDGDSDDASSLILFTDRVQEFLRENFAGTHHSVLRDCCPQSAMPAFFHCLVRALHAKWASIGTCSNKERYADLPVSLDDMFLPIEFYCATDEFDYYDAHRIGGLATSLGSTHKDEVVNLLRQCADLKRPRKSTGRGALSALFRKDAKNERCQLGPLLLAEATCNEPQQQQVLLPSIIRLLDSCAIIYSISAYRQSVLNSKKLIDLASFVDALQQTRSNIQRCPSNRTDILDCLKLNERVIVKHLTSKDNWILHHLATQLSPEFRQSVSWLTLMSINSFTKASAENDLLCFLPDYLVRIIINGFYALRDVFGLIEPFGSTEDDANLLLSFARFLTAYFDDTRIVWPDVREQILSNLVVLSCESTFIDALQRFTSDEATTLLRSLIFPETNLFASCPESFCFLTNKVLLTFWRGDGFAFRYNEEPVEEDEGAADLLKQLANKRLFNISPQNMLLDPYPSKFYQQQLGLLLKSDPDLLRKVLDFLLNKLNSTFTDYLSVLHDARNRDVDSRQVKVINSLLEITVTLVRSIEQIVHLVTDFFTLPSSALFLSRLSQVIGQVLLRLPCTIRQFSLLAAVSGVIYQLITRSPSKDSVLHSLKEEACITSQIIGKVLKVFASLDTMRYVSEQELGFMKSLAQDIDALTDNDEQSACSDDDLCTICYAQPISVVFKPCGHRSCRSCIALQLISRKECFFCKGAVKKVKDFSGNTIKL